MTNHCQKGKALQRPLTCCFLQLDNFKQSNDTLGHEIGDRVLCMGATRIAESVPTGEFVARLGGDEFAVVLHVKSEEFVERVARDIVLGVRITVENAQSIDFLHAINRDQVKGYFLCRSIDAAELDRKLPFICRFRPVPDRLRDGGRESDSESDKVA